MAQGKFFNSSCSLTSVPLLIFYSSQLPYATSRNSEELVNDFVNFIFDPLLRLHNPPMAGQGSPMRGIVEVMEEVESAIQSENPTANDMEEAYQNYNTVEVMLDYEITNGLSRENSSHTRFLLRMKRAADLLRVFFQEILAREGDSLVPPFKKAYNQVFGALHGETIKMVVNFAMEFMMDKSDLFTLIDDDDG
ncbi:hypothetical protein H5410_042272 [Solanum commersonii]|uniref:Glycolipid transfer protein domain-containing protein n=1 Tax=Solanum commersonii TaxID=4109 RepID=A0A9J5XY19_SOLCO|nr:hypothetical protein H5410_042272 [Solanum commersonii]